ncbi:uncharacterized protein BDCG_03949 [Blastomyces dermatitidis ER-3]|uniref:Uncharacterized protein n=1 Tax=Ajellomyces dermatitidis (strain ER-3 / ATCC MYA-2586) TaxID=559297 RepID=A0ABP2EXG3_AJEDR|nr:uncharacterized protein BDCG_03949 [Blastomyces dermatitidis ER-3]EEQ88829.1 hypothetical protein BDCG_03949 [Blastomyces dermatitidis ER-3]
MNNKTGKYEERLRAETSKKSERKKGEERLCADKRADANNGESWVRLKMKKGTRTTNKGSRLTQGQKNNWFLRDGSPIASRINMREGVTVGIAQASSPDEREPRSKRSEKGTTSALGAETAGQAAAWLLQLRLASVIGSVCLGAVTSLLRPLECRVGSTANVIGWRDGRWPIQGGYVREGTEIGTDWWEERMGLEEEGGRCREKRDLEMKLEFGDGEMARWGERNGEMEKWRNEEMRR